VYLILHFGWQFHLHQADNPWNVPTAAPSISEHIEREGLFHPLADGKVWTAPERN
jgi:hypothetical protein